VIEDGRFGQCTGRWLKATTMKMQKRQFPFKSQYSVNAGGDAYPKRCVISDGQLPDSGAAATHKSARIPRQRHQSRCQPRHRRGSFTIDSRDALHSNNSLVIGNGNSPVNRDVGMHADET
jgi:hypothetical protein